MVDLLACMQPKGCLSTKGGRLVETGSHAGHRDKILKSSIQIVKFGEQVAKVTGASQPLIDGLWKTSAGLNDARAVLGIMNPIDGVPRMLEHLQDCVNYYHGQRKRLEGDHYVYDPVHGRERILGMLSSGFKFVEWALFNFIFAIVSPISFAAKYFELGENAKSIGAQFSLFMLCRDTVIAMGHMNDIGLRYVQYNQFLNQAPYHGDANLTNGLRDSYRTEQLRCGVKIVKSGCDIASNTIAVGGFKNVNKWVALSLGLASALIGLVEVGWATSPRPVKFPARN